MTELYIAGQLVVLPESFSITIIEENPFFTKNGKYSYDITLSLLDPINAKIYKHLNRVNNKAALLKNRPAYLVVDNEVVLNGTEVILEHTDKEVKVQLLSGNSELNFLIGGDKKLRDLKLGEAEIYTGTSWMDVAKQVYLDLNKVYPERTWILAPYAAGYDSYINVGLYGNLLKVGNSYVLPSNTQMPELEQGYRAFPQYEPSYSGQVPQPYLCFIVKRIIETIGYELVYNSLEDDPIRKQAYIVHGFRTVEFAKMLPNWTVTEFFENLETWLDCTTIVNSFDKTVKIIYNYQSTGDSFVRVSLDVLDEYTAEYDTETTPNIQSSNVAYDLDDDDYYQYMCIESTIRKRALRDTLQSIGELINLVENAPDESLVFETIYTIGDNEGDFIAIKSNNHKTVKKIDSFRPLLNNNDSDSIDISLKIVPASFVTSALSTSDRHPYPAHSIFWVQIAVAEDYDDLASGGEENGRNEAMPETVEKIGKIQDAIENGTEDVQEKGGSRLRLALYTGEKYLNRKVLDATSGIHSAYYPMPFVEDLYEDFSESKEERYMYGRKSSLNPFRLDVMYNDIYSKTKKTDNGKIYKFSFTNIKPNDILSIFVANNKEYRCIKMERVVTERGFDPIVKGEFYAYDE